ncbi:Serine/threonine protein kinase PknB [Minicystis rosea]|nr:Serine/threonine protein kinase PknB [Minicystis rosea]
MDLDQDELLAAQRIGTRLGYWTLERLLGIGGMASVFFARRTDGAVAALKILHPYLVSIDELRKRFVREGPIGSTLAAVGPMCEGLPQVFESGIAEDGSAYLAMELLEGESYFERMARVGALPADDVLWMAHKVLDVLVVAHAYGVVHRDIKPENVFLTRDGRLKVLDFGIARVLEEMPHGTSPLPEKTMTRTGTRIGSAEYMPPEQARGQIREIDGRSDLFSLGAAMYRLLSGHPLHGNLVDAPLLIAAATEAVAPLAHVAPFVPPVIAAVVDRALAFNKAERYPDAATMRFDVFALRQGREPPYVMALARGQIRPGDRLSTR